jgi:hypothetical protein
MHRWVRFKLDAGRRARDFCRERSFRNVGILRLSDELDRLVAHADQLELDAIAATNAGLAATSRRAELRHHIRHHYLRSLLGIMDAVALKHPGSVTRWSLPAFRADDHTFGSIVRAAGVEAERVAALLDQNGFPPRAVDEMLALLADWEECGRRQDDARQRRVGARAGLEAATDHMLELLQLLDALFRLEYRHDPGLRAAWRSTRHIPWPHDGSLPVAG